MSKSKNIAEDTKSQFDTNVTGKVNKGDKPQKISGETDVLMSKARTNADDALPNYATATSKDTSKAGTVTKKVGAGEQKGTMNTMPMVGKLKGDAKIVNEDDETDDNEPELSEEELAAYNEHRAAVMESLAERIAEYIPTEDKPADMSEHVSVLFDGQDLSEEFKGKATTIFEAAVRSEVEAVLGAILEASTDMIIENDVALTESYDEKIDAAVATISEAWAEANKVGIQSQLKTEITEDFLHGLVKLLQEHNIFLPEEKVDVVEQMADKIMELESELNEQIKINIDYRTQLDEAAKSQVVEKLAEGLTDTQAVKLRTLCEGISSSEDFEEKAAQIKESYFGVKGKTKIGNPLAGEEAVLNESDVNKEAKTISEEANAPAKQADKPAVLTRFAPKK